MNAAPLSLFELTGKKIYFAGHRGMVGAALVRRLAGEPVELLTARRAELDLLDQAATRAWLLNRRPEVVIMAAAKFGGILANASYCTESWRRTWRRGQPHRGELRVGGQKAPFFAPHAALAVSD